MSNQSPLRKELALNIMQVMADTIDGDSSNETAYEYVDNLLDVLIHALPEPHVSYKLVPKEFKAYTNAITEVKQLLLEAKGDK